MFQNMSSKSMSFLEMLHDLAMIWLSIILVTVLLVGIGVFFFKKNGILNMDSVSLEVIWSCFPMIILASIAFPSLYLLSKTESFEKPFFTLKMISNQWSWSSEYDNNLCDHLLDVDEISILNCFEVPLLMPSEKIVRVLLSSSDVLHSLGVPSLGLKLDSVPGRINSTIIDGAPSMCVGSCFELCGTGHSAMPISLLLV